MMFSQCGPQRFISTNDAYDYLPTYFEEGGIKKVLFRMVKSHGPRLSLTCQRCQPA